MTIDRFTLTACAFGLMVPQLTATAASAEDFFLTYHVERFDSAALSLEACGGAATLAASAAGFQAQSQSYPEQLVTVQGGQQNVGSFVVQCIAVDGKTVSVVHGIDYSASPGKLQGFANAAFEAIKAAAK